MKVSSGAPFASIDHSEGRINTHQLQVYRSGPQTEHNTTQQRSIHPLTAMTRQQTIWPNGAITPTGYKHTYSRCMCVCLMSSKPMLSCWSVVGVGAWRGVGAPWRSMEEEEWGVRWVFCIMMVKLSNPSLPLSHNSNIFLMNTHTRLMKRGQCVALNSLGEAFAVSLQVSFSQNNNTSRSLDTFTETVYLEFILVFSVFIFSLKLLNQKILFQFSWADKKHQSCSNWFIASDRIQI